MSDPAKPGKLPALIHNVPGAAAGWHFVDGLPGLYHPDIPVPYEDAQAYLAAHKQLVAAARDNWELVEADLEQKGFRPAGRLPFADPGCPVQLVKVTERQADQGRQAALEAQQQVTRTLVLARRQAAAAPGVHGHDTGANPEAALAHDELAAIAGGKEG